jgi:DNA mismatch repair protein MLH3
VQQSNPVRLTKETLQNAEVIAQADLKFVLARAGDMLIAVDQHAADERVQLERLEREIYDGATNGIHAQTSPTSPTVVLALSDNEMSLLDLHSRSVESFGFSFLYPRESASNGPESSVVVTGVPVVLGVTLAVEDMRVLLHQLGEFDPAASLFQVKPPVFQYILCSKACRGAVMFGDALTHLDCTSLITSLAKCELPFQVNFP